MINIERGLKERTRGEGDVREPGWCWSNTSTCSKGHTNLFQTTNLSLIVWVFELCTIVLAWSTLIDCLCEIKWHAQIVVVHMCYCRDWAWVSTDIVYFPPLFKENNVANNLETICDTFMSPLLNVDIDIHVELWNIISCTLH